MTSPLRRFPDVHALLVTALEGLAGGPEHTGIETPANLAEVLPFVRVRRFGGGSDRFYDFPIVDVDVFGSHYAGTEALAERIRQYLVGPPPAVVLLDRVDCTTSCGTWTPPSVGT